MRNTIKPIYVTQPDLPDLKEFIPYLEQIWNNKILTNNGPFHQQFETALAEYLGVPFVSLFTNGTLALITSLQMLEIEGEVITTPFSFVATAHSLWWNKIKPVFVDIEPDYFNLNPEKIEAAITEKTTAIMPVHVYGNPCAYSKIKEIADKYGLKVIYDAAHAFNVKENGKSILNHGDLAILSFHATKVFNTFEGGAIICHDMETKKQIDQLKNFGFTGETTVVAPGINSKMSEFQSAFGLLQLKYVDQYIEKRKKIAQLYRTLLNGIAGIFFLDDIENVHHNYSYFPIIVDNVKYSLTRDELYDMLKAQSIYCRRYFYPIISNFPTYHSLDSSNKANLPIANEISEKVICLPIYSGLQRGIVERICGIIQNEKK